MQSTVIPLIIRVCVIVILHEYFSTLAKKTYRENTNILLFFNFNTKDLPKIK